VIVLVGTCVLTNGVSVTMRATVIGGCGGRARDVLQYATVKPTTTAKRIAAARRTTGL